MSWFESMCGSLTDAVSNVTGAIYGVGSATVLGPEGGAAVGLIVSETVKEGWPSVCELPGEVLSGGAVTHLDPPPNVYPAGDLI